MPSSAPLQTNYINDNDNRYGKLASWYECVF